MDLNQQRQRETSFYQWFDGGLKGYIDDSRARYRMQLKDAEERRKRKLSVLPSVKSLATVDNCTDRTIEEYHLDPEAFGYSAKTKGNLDLEERVRWLSEIVKIRSDQPFFPFYLWHQKSIKAGYVDGMEACMVSWIHKVKVKKVRKFYLGDKEVTQDVFDQYSLIEPGFRFEDVKEKVVVKDTWWITQLIPGEDILWDCKAPLFDVNLGSWCLVKLKMTLQEIKDQIANGVFDNIKETDLKQYQSLGPDSHLDQNTIATNPDLIDFGDGNDICVWVFFDNEGNDWGVQFSLEGKRALSNRKPANDVFFNGREVNCLPVVIGYNDPELHENVGRGLPKIIAPLEDEATDHRHNYNDAVKQLLRGKYWIKEDSDVDVDDLVNMPVVKGQLDTDFGAIPPNPGFAEVLRAADTLNVEMNSVVPVDITGMGQRVVQKGQNATLGNVQMTQGQMDSRLGVRILTRNKSFFSKVLYLIAQMEFSWETDETIARYAAQKVRPQTAPQPYQPPMAMTDNGSIVDFRQLDFDFAVRIDPGLGAVPLAQKGQALLQIGEAAKALGRPIDGDAILRQLKVLAGYDSAAFDAPPPQPQQPEVDYKVSVTVDLNELLRLAPESGQFLFQKMTSGGASIDVKVKDESANLAKQNGGGFMTPDRTGQTVNATGPEAAAMSEGGQQNRG